MDQDKANLVAQLQEHKGFQFLMADCKEIFEALKNQLENPNTENIQYIQGQVATYRNIFNYIDEKVKESKYGL